MISAIKKSNHGVKAYKCEQTIVQDGLSVSAADMQRMTRNGIPISAQVLSDSSFSPGHEGSDPFVPFEALRGVDFSEAYVMAVDGRRKINKAYAHYKLNNNPS